MKRKKKQRIMSAVAAFGAALTLALLPACGKEKVQPNPNESTVNPQTTFPSFRLSSGWPAGSSGSAGSAGSVVSAPAVSAPLLPAAGAAVVSVGFRLLHPLKTAITATTAVNVHAICLLLIVFMLPSL